MVPPVQVGVASVQLPALPVTVNAPLPALVSRMPFTAPFEEMLRNVTPEAPIVVLVMVRAVPVVLAIVFALPVTFTVPPPVELKPAPAPELIVTLAKLKVAPVLTPESSTPLPPAVVRLVIETEPVALERLMPVPVVVVMEVSLTATPVIAPAGSLMAVAAPVLKLSPLSSEL